jgi:hypothetical protein
MKKQIYIHILAILLLLVNFSSIAQNTTCPVPTATVTTVIMNTSATLTWSPNFGVVYYKVQYRPLSLVNLNWTQVSTQANSIILSGLNCATAYEWQVQSICSNTAGAVSTSAFSPSMLFTTLACTSVCPVPTGMATTSITTGGAMATWATAQNNTVYKIQYRPFGANATAWTQTTVTGSSFSFTNLTCASMYEWQVQTLCNNATLAGASAFSASTVFTTLACPVVCSAPIGLAASGITATTATLNWAFLPPTPAYYMVQYRPANSLSWISATVQAGPSIVLSNLSCNTVYEWQVKAFCNTSGIGGPSLYSSIATFTTIACPVVCPVPTGMATTAITANSAVAGWTAVLNNTVYKIQYRPVSVTATAWIQTTVTGNSFSFANLTCATAYEWQVQTLCSSATSGGISAYSASTVFTTSACAPVCPAPTGLAASSISTTSATLSWAIALPAPAYYMLQYRPANSLSWISITVQGNPTKALSNLVCNTMYEWQVKAFCANAGTVGGASSYSAIATFTTLACPVVCPSPTALTVSNIGTNSVFLNWTSSSPAPAFHYVRYKLINSTTWSSIPVQGNLGYTLTGLHCNSAYVWEVQAVCTSSNGNPSTFSVGPVFTTLPCTNVCVTPSATLTSALTTNSATASWMAPSGVSVFNLQYRIVSNVATNWIQTTVQGSSFTLANLTCGTAYEWQVASVCSNTPAGSVVSNFSPSVFFNTLTCTNSCPTPSGLTSGTATSNSVTLNWQAVSGVFHYKIQYRPIQINVPPTNPWTTLTVQSNTVTLFNLICNTHYEWQVQSICSTTATGTSAFSPIGYFTTAICPATCAAPTGLFATNITPTSALLKWLPAANSFSGNYAVRYRKLNTTTWTIVNSTTNSKLLTGLSIHTYYEWQVQVLCPGSSGTTNGIWSPWSTSTYFHTHFVVSLSPNPADRLMKVVVKTETLEDEQTSIELRNLLGAIVYEAQEKLTVGTNQFEISTSNLSEGLYFLTVSSVSGKEVTKIYVKH